MVNVPLIADIGDVVIASDGRSGVVREIHIKGGDERTEYLLEIPDNNYLVPFTDVFANPANYRDRAARQIENTIAKYRELCDTENAKHAPKD